MRSGAHVIVGARDPERRAALVQELGEASGRIEALPLDLADPSSVSEFAAGVRARCKVVHGLVNNAAVIECTRQHTAGRGLDSTFARSRGPHCA